MNLGDKLILASVVGLFAGMVAFLVFDIVRTVL